MKKYCVCLLVLNLLCIGILGIQRIEIIKKQQTAAEHVETGSKDGASGQKQDQGYLRMMDEHPKVAITFDDGPNAEWTPKLLDGLAERGVKASFFVIGEKAEQNPQIIQRMYEEGHIVGNHTYSHVQLTRLSDSSACEEIRKTNEALYQITGVYPQYVRPPFGSWSENLECSIDLFPVMWTIDTLDWTTKNADKVVNKAISQAKDNSIILLHDNYESSVDAALRIIDELTQKGYEFVTVEQLLVE